MKVKLADGSHYITERFLMCYVDFGVKGAYLKFTVLPQCPLVLGMPFLQLFNPTIDWQKL